MKDNYRKILDSQNKITSDLMVSQSDMIISDLRKDGYKVAEVESGGFIGFIEFDGNEYQYVAKPCSFIHNPLDLIGFMADIKMWRDVLRTITQRVPDKNDYLIVMCAPISLEYSSENVRFVSYFDVVEIK